MVGEMLAAGETVAVRASFNPPHATETNSAIAETAASIHLIPDGQEPATRRFPRRVPPDAFTLRRTNCPKVLLWPSSSPLPALDTVDRAWRLQDCDQLQYFQCW